jgi:uncharacterized repeat protein (TIGR03803 family)
MKTCVKSLCLAPALIACLNLKAAAQLGFLLAVNSEGANPNAGLLLVGNTLYGTAAAGGSSGAGTVFAVNTDGTGFRVLHSFLDGNDGANPWSGLILSGNTLFGVAYGSGLGAGGTVFAVNTDGTGFTNLHHFTYGGDGAGPIGGLILSGNTLYGTARLGGSAGNGTVFSLSLPQPPVARCRHVIVSADANCMASASIDDGSSGFDAGDSIIRAQSPPGPYPLGETSVTMTVIGSHGASDSCLATVTVMDTTPPTITCPDNIVADATSPAGAVANFAPMASDNCSLASVTSSPASGSTFAVGTTTVTCQAIDGSANTNSCTFTVRVKGAAEQISDLTVLVQGLAFDGGAETSLLAKLKAAGEALGRANVAAACGELNAFINLCAAQMGKEQVTADKAVRMITDSTRIRAVLGH